MPEKEREMILSRMRFRQLTPQTITDPAKFRDELTKTREFGVAISNEEKEPGIVSIASPIIANSGVVQAAVALAAPALTTSVDEFLAFAPKLKRAAAEIGKQIA